jgi:hypothetical protein
MASTTTEILRCNNCGGNLQIPAGVRFVTCEFCGRGLEVKREGGIAFTAVVQRLERLAKQVDCLEIQDRIAALERQWMADREQLMVLGSHGERTEPREGGSLVQGGVVAIFGVLWTIIAISSGTPVFFPLFGMLFVGIAVWNIYRRMSMARDYAQRKAKYEDERAALQRQLVKDQGPDHG